MEFKPGDLWVYGIDWKNVTAVKRRISNGEWLPRMSYHGVEVIVYDEYVEDQMSKPWRNQMIIRNGVPVMICESEA